MLERDDENLAKKRANKEKIREFQQAINTLHDDNESIDEATTRQHGRKVEEDLGHPAEAIFAAPFDPAVARGELPLEPRDLRDPSVSLAAWLRALGDRGDLKARAMEASLGGLREDLRRLGRSCSGAIGAMVVANKTLILPRY